jgi:hypothetical protein
MTHTATHTPKPWRTLGRYTPGLSWCGVFVMDGDVTPPDARPCEDCRQARETHKRIYDPPARFA